MCFVWEKVVLLAELFAGLKSKVMPGAGIWHFSGPRRASAGLFFRRLGVIECGGKPGVSPEPS
jgi:hypothetical protein